MPTTDSPADQPMTPQQRRMATRWVVVLKVHVAAVFVAALCDQPALVLWLFGTLVASALGIFWWLMCQSAPAASDELTGSTDGMETSA